MDNRVAPQEDPRTIGKALTGSLGTLWRFRVGDYRVICEIQRSALRILVIRVGHLGDVYR
jgi:mRNA interferase RelE/StbE